MTAAAPVLLSSFEANVLRTATARSGDGAEAGYESAEFLALEMVKRGLLSDEGPAVPRTVAQETAEDVDRRRVRIAKMSPRKRAEFEAAQAQAQAEALRAQSGRRRLCATATGRVALAAHDAQQECAAPSSLEAEIAALVSRIVIQPCLEAELRAREFAAMHAPRLRGSGFSAEHVIDLTEWNCEPQRRAFEEVLRLLKTPGAIVAIVGIRGTGKTTIAAQVAAAWFREEAQAARRRGPQMWRMVPYRKLTDLLGIFKGLYANFGTLDPEKLAGARDALCTGNDLLVIDEVGECEDMAARGPLLTDFLDRVYAAKRRALLISNQTQESFEQGIGASVMSRLTQYGAILECAWPSWRERK